MGVRPRPRLFIPTTDVRRGGAAVRAFAMSVLRAGAALALLALLGCAAAQRVLLRDVESLVFEAGKMTAGRRTAPVPQMAQTGGRAMPLRGIFCRNVGWDGQSVHWECRLPDDAPTRLGKFAIQCEGYDYAGDPYHLAGSCGIEYELLPPGRSLKFSRLPAYKSKPQSTGCHSPPVSGVPRCHLPIATLR